MKINSINQISFKAHYTNVDIGASSLNGSFKISTIDESGNTIVSDKKTVFSPYEMRNEDFFEQNVAQNIYNFEKENKEAILKADPQDELYLTVCYPGPKVSGKYSGFKLSNFFYDNAKENRFTRPIVPENIDTQLKQKGINLVQSRHVNDMAGAAACLLTKVETTYPEILKEGVEIIYLYPGGGLGSGIISVDKGKTIIKPTEIQHIKAHNSESSLESNVGASRIVGNFASAVGLDNETTKKLGGNVKAVCDYNELSKYCNISEEQHKKGAQIAINKYMDSLSELIAVQICATGTKNIILTGAVAHGIKDFVNKNPDFKAWDAKTYKADDAFGSILKDKVNERLTDVGKAILGEPEQLDIKFIRIDDNTQGAQLLQKCEEVGNPTVWFNYYPNKQLT